MKCFTVIIKINIGLTRVSSQEWLQAWEYCQANLIQTLGRASQGVNWSWSRSDIFKKRATKPLLKQKHRQDILPGLRRKLTGLLLSGPKSSFQMKVHLAFNLEIMVWSLEEECRGTESMLLKSSVKFPQSVIIWAAMSSAGVGPLCLLKSTVNTAIYQELLEHFILPSADKLYGDADFIFQQDLAPAHTAKRSQKLGQWPWCYCARLASKLAWPEPHRESEFWVFIICKP